MDALEFNEAAIFSINGEQNHPAPNNGYKALLLINYFFLRIKVTLHSQALAVIY
ncbi:MAG: hypothetical protein ACK5QX_08695 [bacterium]